MAQSYDYAYRGSPQEFMSRVSRIPNLTREQEVDCFERWSRHGDSRALDMLVGAHQKLMVKMVYNARLQGRFDEALQAANEGFLKAVQRFEPERGFRLGTYAVWWAKAELQEMSYAGTMVNVITSAERKKLKANLAGALQKANGGAREPTHEDFKAAAELLDIDVEEITKLYPVLYGGDASLDAPIGDDPDGASRVDFIADPSETPEEILGNIQEVEQAKERLRQALGVLEGREKEVFLARRLQDPPQTLEDLANVFNISRERVRQIEVRAFEKVQAAALGELAPRRKRGPVSGTEAIDAVSENSEGEASARESYARFKRRLLGPIPQHV